MARIMTEQVVDGQTYEIADKQARKDVSDLRSALGTVPSEKTVQGQITDLQSDIKYSEVVSVETGYITGTGVIAHDANNLSVINNISKGFKVIYTGAVYWCPVWGYYADGTAVKLVDTPSASAVYRYTELEIEIEDENIVKVAAWALPSESPDLELKLLGAGYSAYRANLAMDTLLEKSSYIQERYYINADGLVASGGDNVVGSFDNVTKGMRFKYSGGYYPSDTWGVIYGYKLNGTAVKLLNCDTSYNDYIITIDRDDIVAVKAWSGIGENYPEFKFVRTSDSPVSRNTGNIIIVDINGNGDYTDIASAIASAKSKFDVETEQVTIYIKSGIYTIPYKSGATDAIEKGANKISIIGENRDTTIIRYVSTPSKYNAIMAVGGECLIENITFENLWNNDGSAYSTSNRRPYCIHNDYGYGYSYDTPYRTVVRNCKLYDECGAPIGAGLWQNQTQVYEDCEIVLNCKDSQANILGALYVHAPTDSNAQITAVVVRDCECVSKSGHKAISMGNVSGMLPYSQIPCTFQRVIAVSTGETVTDVSKSTHNITFDSALNNLAELDY